MSQSIICSSDQETKQSEIFSYRSTDDLAFRKSLDQKAAARRLNRKDSGKGKRKFPKPSLKSSQPPTKLIRTFDSWREVSAAADFKTRTQWQRSGRCVAKQEAPSARVVYPELVSNDSNFHPDAIVLEESDDFTIVSDHPTMLFHRNQTVAYEPSRRTLSYWEFEKIFFKHSKKDCWIRKTDLYGVEREHWVTEHENPFEKRFHLRNRLTDQLIRQHINQKQIIGVKGGDLTWFVMIDLDFHGRNLELFEKLLISQNRFWSESRFFH